MSRVLFVCLGNICRSPAAEGVFAHLAHIGGAFVEVDSAGSGNWHVGEPPYPEMERAARARGYDLSQLRARQFKSYDFERFDLIIAMDKSNKSDIEALRPEASATPVHLFLEYADKSSVSEVPDPYYTRKFDEALDLIEMASAGLLERITTGSLSP